MAVPMPTAMSREMRKMLRSKLGGINPRAVPPRYPSCFGRRPTQKEDGGMERKSGDVIRLPKVHRTDAHAAKSFIERKIHQMICKERKIASNSTSINIHTSTIFLPTSFIRARNLRAPTIPSLFLGGRAHLPSTDAIFCVTSSEASALRRRARARYLRQRRTMRAGTLFLFGGNILRARLEEE